MDKKLWNLENRKNTFIKRALEKHGNKYDYSRIKYVNNRTKVCIVCPIHGEFWQTPHNHVDAGQGCPKCIGKIKFTTEGFIKRCIKIHGNKYDYSNVEYINKETPVLISCPIHGKFSQIPSVHWSGGGCPKCSKEIAASKRRYTKDQFIVLAKEKHGDKFDYSKVEYINSRTKVCIICPEHGEFWQTPHSHLNYGCKKCSQMIVSQKQTFTTEKFIEKATIVHNNKYDYSKTIYINSKEKVKIICRKHGPFWQNPHSHLLGSGCSKCATESISEKLRDSKDEFINKSKLKHGNAYSYDKVVYVNSKTPVCITCEKHGDFWQIPNSHVLGGGCPKCNKRKSQIEFYNKIKKDLDLDFDFDKRLPWLGQQSLDLYNSKYNFAIEYNGVQHYEPIDFFGGQNSFEYRCELDLKKQKLCKENNCKLWIVKYNFTSEDYEILIKEILNYING